MMNTSSQRLTGAQLIRPVLLLSGSFFFALVFNSFIIHEAGHALGGALFGCRVERLNVNPFGTGGWVDHCPNTISSTGQFVRSMGGPIFGLPISILITVLLWPKKSPKLLPLLMSAPIVCLLNFVGVLDSMSSYPGFIFDYGWALFYGTPPYVRLVISFVSLVAGIVLMNLVTPLAGISLTESFWKALVLNLSTWPFCFTLRLIYQFLAGRSIGGPLSLVIFGLIIASITALTFKPVYRLARRYIYLEPVIPSTGAVWLAVGLGAGLTFAVVALNPIWFA
jgi:hypothetical protein